MPARFGTFALRVARIPDLVWAPFWEAFLILIAGATALWSGHPWLFSSLGPTAYEIVEKPTYKSSRTYNVLVGHAVGLASGYAAVAIFHAWMLPTVNAHAPVSGARLWAAVVAVLVTAVVNLLLDAGQPAAFATALLIALGSMQTAYAALWMAVGIALVALLGEPVRRLRLRGLRARGIIASGRH